MLSPEEQRKKLQSMGLIVVIMVFAIGFTCGNAFFLLMSLV